jgi:hypothetical protein
MKPEHKQGGHRDRPSVEQYLHPLLDHQLYPHNYLQFHKNYEVQVSPLM